MSLLRISPLCCLAISDGKSMSPKSAGTLFSDFRVIRLDYKFRVIGINNVIS
jgi:hypothetical protein